MLSLYTFYVYGIGHPISLTGRERGKRCGDLVNVKPLR